MIITVSNIKGGVGKSTVAVNLASELYQMKKKVMVIDTDPQGSSASFINKRAEQSSIVGATSISNDLHKKISALKNQFDFIIIDAGGRDSSVYRSAIASCDLNIIPTTPSQVDVWVLKEAVDVVEQIQKSVSLKYKILLNRCKTNNLTKEAIEIIKEYPYFETKIYDRVAYGRSFQKGQGVTEFEKNGKASLEIKELIKEILKEV